VRFLECTHIVTDDGFANTNPSALPPWRLLAESMRTWLVAGLAFSVLGVLGLVGAHSEAEVGFDGHVHMPHERHTIAHPHHHGDHTGPAIEGPARSADKYGCIHHDLLGMRQRLVATPIANSTVQMYEVAGPRRTESGTVEYSKIRIVLDTDRLFPGQCVSLHGAGVVVLILCVFAGTRTSKGTAIRAFRPARRTRTRLQWALRQACTRARRRTS
jgi:hypothetical protein